MQDLMNYPWLIFAVTVVCLWCTAMIGVWFHKRKLSGERDSDRAEYGLVLTATLTLLALLIGFSFSMAISRYDQRKNYEEEEANAIGTEYVRLDLIAEPSRQKIKALLVQYLDLRIQRYRVYASNDVTGLMANTARLQDEMWSEVARVATVRTDPVMQSVVTGMNDVINRQGYTQAARWNRIPVAAWALMGVISLYSNFLVGYGLGRTRAFILLVVPIVIGVSFFLIADIDSPHSGLIRVSPVDLVALSDSLKPK